MLTLVFGISFSTDFRGLIKIVAQAKTSSRNDDGATNRKEDEGGAEKDAYLREH